MPHHVAIRRQITLIEEAMKVAGIWLDTVPDWVHQYRAESVPDIWQWLQFVYLPLRKDAPLKLPHYLAPVVTPYTRNQVPEFALLIQRVVELDSLTSTLRQSANDKLII